LERVGEQQLLSCPEEIIEKALAAYLQQNPQAAEAVDDDWPTSFASAEAELEGRTSGAFGPGFLAGLAAAAREERDRLKEAERSRDRDGRERE
jgi:hypothetical protein